MEITFTDVLFTIPMPTNIASIPLSIRANSNEIVRIAPDGAIFWNGREVETDGDFKAAMLDLAKHLGGRN